MELFCRHVGNGEAVIILHGLFGSSDNWMSIAHKMGEKRNVFVPDLRNHGQSPHSDEWNYHAMVEDVWNLIEKYHIQNPVILGHSMGGKVAMHFAVTFPNIVKKLIIVDIAPKFYPVHHKEILNGLNSLDVENLNSRFEANDKLAEYVPDAIVRQFLLKNIARNPEGGFSWKLNLKVITEQIENVGESLDPSMLNFEEPTMFIRGARSNYISPEEYKVIAEVYPNNFIASIRDTGHWVHAENTNQFLKVVEGFLDL
jgi:pimeloyl-ACP methyl ester carboxylesterase